VNFAPEKSALFRWEHKESARIHKLLMSGSPEHSGKAHSIFPYKGL